MGIDIGSRRACFLDRDGVINRTIVRNGRPHPPAHVGELEVLPGVPAALGRLRDAGFCLVVVTNQPDVARGTQARSVVEAIHAVLSLRVAIDEFRVCYHDDDDRCGCRKPEPGLLVDAAREHGIDLTASFMIGDRWRDIEAGRRAGCRTILIDWGYEERIRREPDRRVASLAEAVEWILEVCEAT